MGAAAIGYYGFFLLFTFAFLSLLFSGLGLLIFAWFRKSKKARALGGWLIGVSTIPGFFVFAYVQQWMTPYLQ
jgi:hypothetical protein